MHQVPTSIYKFKLYICHGVFGGWGRERRVKQRVVGGGGGRGLLQLDIHSLDGLKNGKIRLVCVHEWQGTQVTLMTIICTTSGYS